MVGDLDTRTHTPKSQPDTHGSAGMTYITHIQPQKVTARHREPQTQTTVTDTHRELTVTHGDTDGIRGKSHTNKAKEDHSCLHTRTDTHTHTSKTSTIRNGKHSGPRQGVGQFCAHGPTGSQARGRPCRSPHPSSQESRDRPRRREGAQPGTRCSGACPGLRNL